MRKRTFTRNQFPIQVNFCGRLQYYKWDFALKNTRKSTSTNPPVWGVFIKLLTEHQAQRQPTTFSLLQECSHKMALIRPNYGKIRGNCVEFWRHCRYLNCRLNSICRRLSVNRLIRLYSHHYLVEGVVKAFCHPEFFLTLCTGTSSYLKTVVSSVDRWPLGAC